jgi:hypothetical protein
MFPFEYIAPAYNPSYLSSEIMWIYTLSLDTFHGVFKTRSAIRGSRDKMVPVHALHGDYIIMGDPLLVWYTKSLDHKSALTIMKNDAHIVRDFSVV